MRVVLRDARHAAGWELGGAIGAGQARLLRALRQDFLSSCSLPRAMPIDGSPQSALLALLLVEYYKVCAGNGRCARIHGGRRSLNLRTAPSLWGCVVRPRVPNTSCA